uniref:G_PROTEIN_RECEP_F1_2 domain-containing protein n=1 Tax=Brugia pahangi TaxID=6280 RepID=A0A0N4T601_BRUPA
MTYSYCIIILFLILPSFCLEENATVVTDIRNKDYEVAKYIAVLFIIILLLYGIISNTLLATVLFCKDRNNHYSRDFTLIVLQVIISNFTAFLPQILVVLPEIFKTKNNSYFVLASETTWINRAFSTLNTFSFFSMLHFLLLLTLNRCVALFLPKRCSLFESAKLYFLIAFVWLSVLAITFADFYYCTRRFLVWNLSWEASCTESSGMSKIWW